MDALLLIEAAVYVLADHAWISPTTHLYALRQDIEARGLITHQPVNLLTYTEWVTLTTQYARVHCWY